MTHYIEDPTMVRVDVFKKSGKWYTTLAIKWLYYGFEEGKENLLIQEIFVESLEKDKFGKRYLSSDYILVCLEPYHTHAYPLMLIKDGGKYYNVIKRG